MKIIFDSKKNADNIHNRQLAFDDVAGLDWSSAVIILKNAVGGVVGANLFARSTSYVRINSHLQKSHNPLKYWNIPHQLRFLGLSKMCVKITVNAGFVFLAISKIVFTRLCLPHAKMPRM